MAPFYRVFANTLGNGRWFDTYIAEPAARSGPDERGGWLMKMLGKDQPAHRGRRRGRRWWLAWSSCSGPARTPSAVDRALPRAPSSLYEGSDVRILGVAVGEVVKVTPTGTRSGSTLHYDASTRSRPTPRRGDLAVHRERPVRAAHPGLRRWRRLPDGAELALERTATPLELDEIFGSLNDLNIALGPEGANKPTARGVGPLTRCWLDRAQPRRPGRGAQQDPEELRGTHQDARRRQGRPLRHRRRRSRTSPRTWPRTTRRCAGSTTSSPVSPTSWPASARSSRLRCATSASRMTRSAGSCAENRASLTSNIAGLTGSPRSWSSAAVALDEILDVAPVALTNLYLAGNVEQRDARHPDNRGELLDPAGDRPGDRVCARSSSRTRTATSSRTRSARLQVPAGRAQPFADDSDAAPRRPEPIDRSLGGLRGGRPNELRASRTSAGRTAATLATLLLAGPRPLSGCSVYDAAAARRRGRRRRPDTRSR